MIYGYARISTRSQNIERQLRNISNAFPTAKIFQDKYTGKTIDRPQFTKLLATVSTGDTIVFDSVSRMSRCAAEGWELYKKLYSSGVNLVFLNEPHINTEVYTEAMKAKLDTDLHLNDADTNECMTAILTALNKYILKLAERQFILVFDMAEAEIADLSTRTQQGIQTARENGKQIGQAAGSTLDIAKEAPIKALIRKYSRDFDGSNTDAEVLSILSGATVTITDKKAPHEETVNGKKVITYPNTKTISAKLSRNTYYKYKRELLSE